MKTIKAPHLAGASAIVCAVLCGCKPSSTTDHDTGGDTVTQAVAVMQPTEGNEARGTVTFTSEGDGIRVVADLTGLAPGEHGFHIHEHGDCSATDATSAGGHFNPTGAAHGAPDAAEHHLGDLGNLLADSAGNAHLERVFGFLRLNGDQTIVGRGLIVHADRDDLTSQPTGNAGARVACGVIETVP